MAPRCQSVDCIAARRVSVFVVFDICECKLAFAGRNRCKGVGWRIIRQGRRLGRGGPKKTPAVEGQPAKMKGAS